MRFVTVLLAIACALALAAEQPLPEYERVTIETPPRPIADFALTDQDGRDFRFSSLRGQPALVFFGFAHCLDICPTTLLKLRRLKQSAPRELRDVRVVMISVDGERDSPQILKAYLSAFRQDFIGLTGPSETVRDIAARFPAVFVRGIPAAPGGDYSVQHSSLIYAIDREGRVRAAFSDAEVEAMAGVMRVLARPMK